MIDFAIKHEKASKDDANNWRCMTVVSFSGHCIKIVSARRPDGDLTTTARAYRDAPHMPRLDFSKELRRTKVRNVTKTVCNMHHFAAVRDVANLVREVEEFYKH